MMEHCGIPQRVKTLSQDLLIAAQVGASGACGKQKIPKHTKTTYQHHQFTNVIVLRFNKPPIHKPNLFNKKPSQHNEILMNILQVLVVFFATNYPKKLSNTTPAMKPTPVCTMPGFLRFGPPPVNLPKALPCWKVLMKND